MLSLQPCKRMRHNSKLLDALTFDVNDLDSKSTLLISQVYDLFIASDVKLKLLDYYGAEKKYASSRKAAKHRQVL